MGETSGLVQSGGSGSAYFVLIYLNNTVHAKQRFIFTKIRIGHARRAFSSAIRSVTQSADRIAYGSDPVGDPDCRMGMVWLLRPRISVKRIADRSGSRSVAVSTSGEAKDPSIPSPTPAPPMKPHPKPRQKTASSTAMEKRVLRSSTTTGETAAVSLKVQLQELKKTANRTGLQPFRTGFETDWLAIATGCGWRS
ncbi:hypothetical protein BDZ89DRAFT_1035277 [Hymenopellis radicata]|nr:hypothetical protein BDZ89DRAFT_1035277 [Hymenopellis radicata]